FSVASSPGFVAFPDRTGAPVASFHWARGNHGPREPTAFARCWGGSVGGGWGPSRFRMMALGGFLPGLAGALRAISGLPLCDGMRTWVPDFFWPVRNCRCVAQITDVSETL